ncbi:U7 snRNA-associated Sm-like protein LSm10 [Manduca sexta]|uniref:U7 snRNA-associated Sm-like protein LSm10 n=1 Tax=Manduca sexta TaxID=7130 RepID=UPI001182C0A0|nr:U7 snRNA-associated Sm-like protein LSm10 [Manduca sexta]XP_030034579.1 U7 snRNA-associated Sm-like protein LSm10 [Manduca sexta]XP_037300406.1 U7 snRNA-associated Sm-like protein LSm10 [Manduca sexta]XP_037300408.1 U7 snRNA-associated Sm-like protein LSm10 [Manduca sexta]XP_037302390.1 U7 snRNA-associated Sm-like protein LSm10 [Manduca sexta]XP_037302391.1 U7 snRNA-associated Sm-like protein LSm10 [Manduca sexta]XP_037302392.1 U7 snRNA-associated Sm-like protein LSm10 [Manduca sexta]XP_0
MFIGNAKEKFNFHNTLLCIVKGLQNKNITLDLRNDAYVCGTIETVDGFMNISFSNAVYCDTHGNEFSFENLYVQARNIRYVHIPETMPIISTIKNEVCRQRAPRPAIKELAANSRKMKKALKQHMEIVASLDTE